ncbi:MAG: chromosome segregation protein SMC, partial [Oscillospiraceae bacterium]|nr:chromosome segregation protein SMC [Oscillospiraceae bacterium]
ETLETASAAEAKALLSALAAAAQEVLDRDAALRQTLLEEERQREVQEEDRAAAQAALKDAKAQRVALGNTVSGYALRLEQRRQRVQAGTDRHIKLQMEEHALQSRLQMLSEMETLYEGYSKAVKLVMGEAKRGRLKGICGPVAGLIQVPDAYAVAIETALGGAMQHIVVEQEEDGKAAIESLKRREGGRGTFLPLSAIRPAEFQFGAVTQEPGFVGLGDGLVQCERKYQAVISHLLGRVVVAEDLDRAIAMTRKYHHRLKIVTLDGQVLNPGGSMTGGSASRSAGILSRANELARLKIQLETVREDLAKAAQAKETAQREETAAAYELETAQERLRTQENQILQIETRQTALNQQITDLQTRQTAQRAELKQMEARSAQIEQETAQVRTRIETLEGAAAALRAESEAKARGRGALQEKLEAVQAEIALENVALAALEAERTTLEQALRELEDLKREMTGDRAQQEKLLAELDEHNETLSAQILEQEQLLQTIQAENSGRQAAIDRLKEERLALEAKRTQTDKASRTQNNALLELERTVSVLEQKKAAAGMEEQQILEKLWETYELSHAGASAQRITLESVPKAVRRIAELKKSISALGNINLDAIEEFQRINERYTYLIGQRDDVAKAQKSLKDIIADITSEMRRIFSEQFTVINQAFGETFSALFGGGKAALELEDPDDILGCGIEIRVQPPGKALKILSLLSGGEKAFVAIALYFAILKVRPTPFCVMDEIEAALDDANVERFARYLRQMCRQTQFIVITHRRGTMEEADVLYGVTMQEQGVSRLLTINLNDVERELHLAK